MKIYLVIAAAPDERWVKGVFTSKEAMERALPTIKERNHAFDEWEIEEWEDMGKLSQGGAAVDAGYGDVPKPESSDPVSSRHSVAIQPTRSIRVAAHPTDNLASNVHKHDCPQAWAFWEEYALGSKTAPSCLVCGASVSMEQRAIQHAELPDIFVCACCAERARNQTCRTNA